MQCVEREILSKLGDDVMYINIYQHDWEQLESKPVFLQNSPLLSLFVDKYLTYSGWIISF